jgi:hypothetical protein
MKRLNKRPFTPESSIEDFVERHNIAHYRDRLKTETDPFRRVILHDLLAKEEARQVSHVNIYPIQRRLLGHRLTECKKKVSHGNHGGC